jgi:hypothetical protein
VVDDGKVGHVGADVRHLHVAGGNHLRSSYVCLYSSRLTDSRGSMLGGFSSRRPVEHQYASPVFVQGRRRGGLECLRGGLTVGENGWREYALVPISSFQICIPAHEGERNLKPASSCMSLLSRHGIEDAKRRKKRQSSLGAGLSAKAENVSAGYFSPEGGAISVERGRGDPKLGVPSEFPEMRKELRGYS